MFLNVGISGWVYQVSKFLCSGGIKKCGENTMRSDEYQMNTPETKLDCLWCHENVFASALSQPNWKTLSVS